ncbi:MAG TPA: response regulator, partial [Chitinophagales bacterium]|nr:response regulator [Chitinophagales bacterium]
MYKILVVENNQEILRGYIDTVNTLFPNQITITSAENQTDALSKLNNPNNDYVGAIIDLRLDATETDGSGGNEVLRQIKQNLRFPIFVLSGHTEDLEDSIVSKEPLFNIREKNTTEGDFATIVNRIIAINKTGITNILSRNGQIETWLKDIFWTHLAPIMPYWITAAENDNNIEKWCYDGWVDLRI